MAFIDDAKELLNDEQFTKLQLLARKSADFETTIEEDMELAELKLNVKNSVAKRDAAKNLEFLKTGQYSIETVLELMNSQTYDLVKVLQILQVDKEKLTKAIKQLYPTQTTNLDISVYSINEKPQAYNLSKRITTELSNAIKKGGVKEFVKNLTVDGRAWLEKNHISPKGKFKDKTIYPNVSTIATKLKLDKDELIKELTKKK